MPLVVGIRGPAGVGKSTVAALLSMSGLFEIHSFADPMRGGLHRMGITKNKHPQIYRKFAQDIGEEMRQQDPNHWVALGASQRDQTIRRNRHVVIDDLRFPNEAAICDLVFFLRPEGFEPADLGARAGHVSEAWNRLYWENPDAPGAQSFPIPTVTIRNPKGSPMVASQAIYEAVRLRIQPIHPSTTIAHAGGSDGQPHSPAPAG